MGTRVEPTPLLLDGDKHAEITSTGVFRFIYDGGQLCLNRYDLAAERWRRHPVLGVVPVCDGHWKWEGR